MGWSRTELLIHNLHRKHPAGVAADSAMMKEPSSQKMDLVPVLKRRASKTPAAKMRCLYIWLATICCEPWARSEHGLLTRMVSGQDVLLEWVEWCEGHVVAPRGRGGMREMVNDGLRGEGGVGDEVSGKSIPVTVVGVGNEDVAVLEGGVGESNGVREEGQV